MTFELDLRRQARVLRPELGEVSPYLRERAIATWHGRMVNEYRSHRVFESLAEQLERAGLSAERANECRGFSAEERQHGVLCGAVVEAVGGEARARIASPRPVPDHPEVSPLEGVLRNVLSVCTCSETVAVALIGAERLEMPEGPLRDLLSRIYADEVGHARFGWKLCAEVVPTLDDDAKDRLGAYLRAALGHLEQHELQHIPPGQAAPGDERLGLCSGDEARLLFYDTVFEVILPRLEALGLSAERAWNTRVLATTTERQLRGLQVPGCLHA